ncbi:MAG: hypothetical protein PHG54_06580 [Smithellaceae bacterium]|nr:hypothetical protein [Smithellaceae bacterium]NLX52521.1 hypothetical protein [Deltaproteobacteria bacterium]
MTGKRNPDKTCALFWDESFLWGLIARRSLADAGLPFDLIRAGDIRAGRLSRYRMIFVPGGWAREKLAALGAPGRAAVRSFVNEGGAYLGICGGAGLATEKDMGLVGIQRKPTPERVPSFSGRIRLALADSEIWNGVPSPVFSAWWPLQFHLPEGHTLRVLASYAEALPDAMSADIPVGKGRKKGWPALEERYGILLDPLRLQNEPAVVEGRFGQGRVLLSLVHFDTPGDANGAAVLRNLWSSLMPGHPHPEKDVTHCRSRYATAGNDHALADIRRALEDLLATGQKYQLWRRRNPWLLEWRRGVRGMEYSTLAALTGEIAAHFCLTAPTQNAGKKISGDLREDLQAIRDLVLPFQEKARQLLEYEKRFLEQKPDPPALLSDDRISRLREELFGTSIRHGGSFRTLIAAMDRLLYKLFTQEQKSSVPPVAGRRNISP